LYTALGKTTKNHLKDLFSYHQVNILSAADGKCVAEMKISQEHTNTFGTLHGGMTATLVDYLSGCALLTHKNVMEESSKISHSGVSVDLHIT
jgi:Uncharacterized protein, possibly involved in aromatic compounds catabolism